jgi:hypothetical protein
MTGRALTEHELNLCRTYINTGKLITELNAERVKARDQLAASLGEDAGLVCGQKAAYVRRTRPVRFNALRFKADHPALFASYCEPADIPVATLHIRPGLVPVEPWDVVDG